MAYQGGLQCGVMNTVGKVRGPSDSPLNKIEV